MLLLLHSYSGYCIAFDTHSTFSLPDGTGFGKNAIIVGANMSSSLEKSMFWVLVNVQQVD